MHYNEQFPELPGERQPNKKIWTEKYRPKTLDEIIGQENIVKILKSYSQKPVAEIPPMLFYGSYGLGKTTAARAFIPDLPMFHDNSAKDRGIQYARLIDYYLYNLTLFPYMHNSDSQSKPSRTDGIKIIIDEAEQITPEAQVVLRDGMERGGKWAVIIMITNNMNKINEGLKERFPLKLEFKLVPDEKMRVLAKKIIQAENVYISSEDLEKVIRMATGIPRRLVQNLNIYADTGVLPEEQESMNNYD